MVVYVAEAAAVRAVLPIYVTFGRVLADGPVVVRLEVLPVYDGEDVRVLGGFHEVLHLLEFHDGVVIVFFACNVA